MSAMEQDAGERHIPHTAHAAIESSKGLAHVLSGWALPSDESLVSFVTVAGPELDTYLQHFYALEAAAIADGYTAAERISAFRKIYYDSHPRLLSVGIWLRGSWDILIPGAAHVRYPDGWATPAAQASIAYLASHRDVLIGRQRVDMGHVLVGADTANHPTPIRLGLGAIRLRDNRDAATWVGDLASVVVECIHRSRKPLADLVRARTPLLEAFYDSPGWGQIGTADMAGNADGYALDFAPSRTLTESLLDYYATPDGGARSRYTTFAGGIGLGRLTENGITLSGDTPTRRRLLHREVFNGALAYAASIDRTRDVLRVLLLPFRGMRVPTLWEAYWTLSGWVVDLFISRLTDDVRRETGGW